MYAVQAVAMIRALLGCEWGTEVWIAGDREPCHENATKRIALHGPAQPVLVQACAEHAAKLFALTDPHDGSS